MNSEIKNNNLFDDNMLKQEKKLNIKSSNEYMLWLEQITQENNCLNCDTYIYFSNNFTKKDESMIKDIPLLYEIVEEYANENYIYPTISEYGSFYKIKYNDIGYRLYVVFGQTMQFICSRVEIDNEEEFIDFNDIICNKKQDNVDMIDLNLKLLSKMIENMVDSSVPVEAINETTKNTLKRVLKK